MDGETLPSGYRFTTLVATGLIAPGGSLFPGNGTPPAAMLSSGRPISEKSPTRSFAVGTVALVVWPCLLR